MQKIVIWILLFAMFLVIFGYPAYKKYAAKGIFVEHSQEHPEEITSPAITVCPRNPFTKLGWRKNLTVNWFNMTKEGPCRNSDDANEFGECFDKSTYTIKEAMYDEELNNTIPITKWQELITILSLGKCFTLGSAEGMIGFSFSDALRLPFSSNLEYLVLVHDPDFILITSNPTITPRLSFSINKESERQWIFIQATKYKKMNQPNHPCQEDPNYSFRNCISRSISSKIGCRAPWDSVVDGPEPCTDLHQLARYEEEITKIIKLEKSAITKYTGCNNPCNYFEYKLGGDPVQAFDRTLGLNIMFGSGTINVVKEERSYPLISFIAEFGGSLGLFLGFSILDSIELLCVYYQHIRSYCSKKQNYTN